MKSETLEKLKKEAADALSRHICTLGVGSAQEALAMVQVLAALNGMTADEPSDVAKDVRRAYEDALLYGTGAYATQYDAARNDIGVVTAPRLPKLCPVLGCTYAADHNAAHTYAKTQTKPVEPCPYATLGCSTLRNCEFCRREAYDRKSQEQRANVPSGMAMLLDGPAPTPKQVAHIRAEALEEAAREIEAMNPSVRQYTMAASVLRDMKSKGGG